MTEDDFLIPRRSRSSAPETGTSPRPEKAAQGMRIDPQVLEERRRRKEAVGPHPKTVDAKTDEPWRYMDRRIGDAFPTFEEPLWRLGDTARWMAERTREAVDGLSDEERLLDIVLEIQRALAAGEVRSFSHTPNDPVPRELPSETWALYQLAVEERDSFLWIVPVRSSGSPGDERVLLDLRLSREDVLRQWPDDKAITPPREVGTIAAENACRLWLTDLMKTKPNNPQPKEAVRETAEKRFPKLGKRAFDRAWAAAISHAAADRWSAPGRRS